MYIISQMLAWNWLCSVYNLCWHDASFTFFGVKCDVHFDELVYIIVNETEKKACLRVRDVLAVVKNQQWPRGISVLSSEFCLVDTLLVSILHSILPVLQHIVVSRFKLYIINQLQVLYKYDLYKNSTPYTSSYKCRLNNTYWTNSTSEWFTKD